MYRFPVKIKVGVETVRIAVIGTGYVGGTLGTRWAQKGHQVTFGTRDPSAEKVLQRLAQASDSTRAAAPVDAVADAEVVVLALPWNQAKSVVESLGDLSGKIIIDCINPLNASFTGLDLGFSSSAAEEIAGWAPDARVVKAFNTVSAASMANPIYHDQQATSFFCGDDADAKKVVEQLTADLDLEPVDAGPLVNARQLEPLAMLYIHLAVHEGWGSDCAFKIMKR